MPSQRERRFRPLWKRKPHFVMPSIEAPFLAGGGTTSLPDTWPNGVPYIDEDTRKENLNDPAALHDLIGTLYLYISRHTEAKLTTEQKELLADIVEREWSQRLDDYEFDRWWQA